MKGKVAIIMGITALALALANAAPQGVLQLLGAVNQAPQTILQLLQ